MADAQSKPIETKRELAIVETAIESYRTVFTNFGALVRITWLWLVLAVIAFYALQRSGLFNAEWENSIVTPDADGRALGLYSIVAMLAFIGYIVAFSSIAVGWHRTLLLRETSTAPLGLRLDKPVLSYIWLGLLTCLALLLITLIAGIPVGFLIAPFVKTVADGQRLTRGGMVGAAVFALLAILPGWLVITRWMLSFPAAALGRKLSLTESMRRTRGFTWPLFAGSLLVIAPSWVVSTAFDGLFGSVDEGPLLLIRDVLNAVVSVISMIAGIGFMSLVYQRLVGVGNELPVAGEPTPTL